MSAGSCPRLAFKTIPYKSNGGLVAVRIEAREAGKRGAPLLGAITMKFIGPKEPAVSHVAVEKAAQRCGIGTKLYEQAAAYACKKYKRPLQSDIERSAPSQAFWQKQVAKGRARCVEGLKTGDPIDDETPTMGRGDCYRYAFNSCPPPSSLFGLTRRK